MSWIIGLYVGESFAEISAKQQNNSQLPFWRWYLPQISLEKGIQRFLNENNIREIKEVIVTTRLARQIINRRLGQPPALLVTEGFESWPFMNLPVRNEHFSMHPQRSKPPLSPHLIFGLTGRMNAEGKEEKPIDFDELEFLSVKLQLNKVKRVAIGLMHSTLNPQHEQQVEKFLLAKGFHVHPSYHLSLCSAEKPRWWHSVLNAFLEPAMLQMKEQIHSGFASVTKPENYLELLLSDAPPSANHWSSPLGTFFGSSYLLSHFRQKNSHDSLLYLGLEEFFILPGRTETQMDWISDFGRVFLPHPETRELRLQPSTVIAKNAFGCPSFSREIAGFEPGPMCFGKGVKPLFLDLLFVNDHLGNIEIFRHYLQTKTTSRIKEILSAYSRDALKGSDYGEQDSLRWMEDLALQLLASEIRYHCGSESSRIRTTGPMSSIMVPLLQPLLKDYQLSPLTEYNQPLGEQLLQIKEMKEWQNH